MATNLPIGKAWSPTASLNTWPWITSDGRTPNINNPYHSSFEANRGAVQDGVGLAVPLDSIVTSLSAGTVMAAAQGQDLAPAGANWNYGGFIVVRSTLPGIGTADVFYRHMDTIEVKKGDIVHVGSRLGLSGGQTQGGIHPESSVFTTGPHLDVGINPSTLPYTSIGPNIDPTVWLNTLIAGGPSVRDGIGMAGSNPIAAVAQKGIVVSDQLTNGYGPVADSFTGIETALDASMQFQLPTWSSISQGTNWWDYALPWEWGRVAQNDARNLSGILWHDIGAILIRGMFILAGIILCTAFVAGLVLSAVKAGEDNTAAVGNIQNAMGGGGNLPMGNLTEASALA